MPESSNPDILSQLLKKLAIYLDRPAVQSQLTTVITALLAALVLAWLIRLLYYRRVKPRLKRPDNLLGRGLDAGEMILNWLLFPMIGWLLLSIGLERVLARQTLTGIIDQVIFLIRIFFVYRLALAAAYGLFGVAVMRRYHYRLLAPLFALFTLYHISSNFIDILDVATIALGEVSGERSPPTVGSLFLATVGLYFWVDSILGVEEIIKRTIVRFTRMRVGTVEAFLALLRYLLIGIGLYYALVNLGFDTTTIAAITGGLSVGLGFGLREVFLNFISGIIILFEGSIQPGDILEYDGRRLNVTKLGIRSTVGRRFDGTESIVPNHMLFTSEVINRTGSDSLYRNLIPIRASYKSDPNQVMALIKEIANSHPDVLIEPHPPIVAIAELGEYAVHYMLLAWIDHRQIGPRRFQAYIYQQVLKVFAEQGIEIPYPRQDIQLQGSGGAGDVDEELGDAFAAE